jgi:threonine/homoserine/homoserine lactone efflux protein
MPLDHLSLFFAASVLLALAPGPDNIFVITQAALRGPGAGLLVTLGLCTGLLGHTAAVALGVAVVFQSSALAFTVLKLVGAAYLLVLAWQAFRAPPAVMSLADRPALSPFRLYCRGIIMNVTNPKVSLFFLAFLPQFADPAWGSLTLQLILLGGLFIAATLIVFGTLAAAAGSLGAWLGRSARAQRTMNRLAGGVFAMLAVNLLITQR